MKIGDFFELVEEFENSVALDDDYFIKKYSLSSEQIEILYLLMQQRQSLVTPVYVHYFKDVKNEN